MKLGLFSLPSSLVLGKIASYLYNHPRPFIVEHTPPLIPHATTNGFPSDHTLLVMSLASIIFVYHRKMGILLFALGILIGISRILVKVHYPIDILGSTIIAVGATFISLYCSRKVLH